MVIEPHQTKYDSMMVYVSNKKTDHHASVLAKENWTTLLCKLCIFYILYKSFINSIENSRVFSAIDARKKYLQAQVKTTDSDGTAFLSRSDRANLWDCPLGYGMPQKRFNV